MQFNMQGATNKLTDLLFLVGPSEDVVHADLIILCQGAENVRRNHPLAALIIGVSTLRYVDRVADLLLCQIGVLAKIANTLKFFHIHHRYQYNFEQYVLLLF